MKYDAIQEKKKETESCSKGLLIANIIVWSLAILEVIRTICGINF